MWTKKIVTATLDKQVVKEVDTILKNPKTLFKSRSAFIEESLKRMLKSMKKQRR